MPSLKRIRTNYPGVFYINGTSSGGKPERIYYIRYRKAGRMIEEKAGRQFQDDMTPARAANIRTKRIEGAASNQERREEAKQEIWTLTRLWQDYSVHKLPTKGLATDRSRFQKFIESALGNKRPEDLSPLDLDRLRLQVAKSHKPQTVKHVISLLVRIVNHGARLGLCPGLPFKPPTIKVHNLRTEDLSPEQLQALMEAIDQEPDIQAANFMRLVLATGMRRGEVFQLQWQDLDFERGFVHLRTPKSGVDTKIPMNSAAREILSNHPRTSDFVFPGRGNRARTRYPKAIDRIREKAGLPPDFRPIHGLRHFFASQLASSGKVDMYVLQRLLTHRAPTTTMRYSHLRDQPLRLASDLVVGLLGEVVNGNKAKVANLKREE